MRLLEGRMPLRRLPVPQVHQCLVFAIKGTRPDFGRGGGGESKIGAARRAELTSLEATRKNIRQANADMTMMTEEKEDETGDSEGPAGDLLRYVPTGEDQRIRDIYGDWVHSNDGAHLSKGVQDDKAW